MKTPAPRRSIAQAPFQVSRRSFVSRLAAAAALTGLPVWFLERELAAQPAPTAPVSPNDRPGVALIGCGGQGSGDAGAARAFGDIVAVCDVDSSHAANIARRFSRDGKAPDVYSDFRKVLERKDVHCVINGTPDHWHSLINIGAAKAKKDVYSEKPLTLTIDEGKHVVKAVRENNIILQTGTQQRSNSRFRLCCELVRNGRIGKLKSATVYLPAGLREGPFSPSPVPVELNWDFWQGQAPAVEYVKQRCHTNFRFWYEYSGGTMTDWGAHHNDIAYWAIGILAPERVESKVLAQPIPGGYTTISEYEVKYTYANGVELNIKTTRDDNVFGGSVNPNGQHNGIRFEGETGWIWVNRGGMDASDEAILQKDLPDTAERLYKSNDHMGNFFDCVKSRKAPICEAEIGHRSATMCHMAAISLRTGLSYKWDSAAEKFIGDNAETGNKMLAREMRKPYDYSMVA